MRYPPTICPATSPLRIERFMIECIIMGIGINDGRIVVFRSANDATERYFRGAKDDNRR